MLRCWRFVTATVVLGMAISTASGGEISQETLNALGLSGMRVIHDESELNWPTCCPRVFVDPYDMRPHEPGIQEYSRPTANFLRRHLTSLP